MKCKVGTISQKTSTGSQGYTGIGFKPKVVIFWGGGQTAAGVAAHAIFHFGASDGSTSFACRARSRDSVGTSACTSQDNTGPVSIYDHTGTSVAAAALTSLDSDGFTLNWTHTDGTARKINYLAIGGDVQAKVGEFSEQDTGVTGVGFKPRFLLFAASPDSTSRMQFNMSFVCESDERAICGDSEGGVGTSNTLGQLDRLAWQRVAASVGAFQSDANLVSMDGDGFTLTWNSGAGTPTVHYIALGGVYADGSVLNSPTSAPRADANTFAFGFRASLMLVMSESKADSSPGPTANHSFMFGAFDRTTQGCAGYFDENNVGTTNAQQNHDETHGIELFDSTGAIVDEGTIGFSGNGYVISWNAADATARSVAYVGLRGRPPARAQAVCT